MVCVGNGQTAQAPGKNGVVYTSETGAVRAQADLNGDVFVALNAVAGHAFSAQLVTTVKQIAEDGTPRVYSARDLFARDAMGRWYCEHRMHPARGSYVPGLVTAQAWDPVSRTLLNLDMARKFALVSQEEGLNANLDRLRTKPVPTRQMGMFAGSESMVVEDLGERTMDGLTVWGVRVTMTFAPEVMGSSAPLTKVIEEWYSDELGMDMEIHVVNPVKGEMTIRVEHLDRHDPPQSLFEVPPGFKEIMDRKR